MLALVATWQSCVRQENTGMMSATAGAARNTDAAWRNLEDAIRLARTRDLAGMLFRLSGLLIETDPKPDA